MRRLFGPVFIGAGLMHFLKPRFYEAIMPEYLPAHRELVYASGAAEIIGGAAIMHPRTRRFGMWFSVATLVAVFPANIDMALHPDKYDIPHAALIARLPLQVAFIAWALAAGRD